MTISVVHIVAGLWKDTGGPAEVIPNLCRAQAAAGAEVTLCSLAGDVAPQVIALEGSGVDVRLFSPLDRIVRFTPELESYLTSLKRVDIIHNHGHWLWPNWCAMGAANKLGAGLVTSPHGTLVPGMLATSTMKKRLAWQMFDKRLIAQADVIHALSVAEQNLMLRQIGLHHAKKVRVVPNGVGLGQEAGQHTGDETGTILFLSRVTSIKGIIQLLLAWQRIALEFPGWTLKIAGPVDASIAADVANLAEHLPTVEQVGPIYADERWPFYRSASAFVLPTLGEGLPTTLLEAAAHRLPVITTPEANFDALYEAGGSILTSAQPEALGRALSNFFKLKGHERRAIGERGAALIEAEYQWEVVASKWLSIYSDIHSSRKTSQP